MAQCLQEQLDRLLGNNGAPVHMICIYTSLSSYTSQQ